MLTFFDIREIVYYEFVPTGKRINKVYYLEVLEMICMGDRGSAYKVLLETPNGKRSLGGPRCRWEENI